MVQDRLDAPMASVSRVRVHAQRFRLWFLLSANRWLLTGSILLAVFVVLLAGSHLEVTPFRTIAQTHDGVQHVFTAFIGAIITGTTIVVTINQLVLSQELGAVGDQRERMQKATDFRRTVESEIDDPVAPAEPAAFLGALVGAVGTQADRLEEATDGETAVQDYVDQLRDNTSGISEELEDAQFGTFGVIWHALAFEYAELINEARRLQTDEHPEAVNDCLRQTVDLLELYGPAREHFKTLYFQWALIDLSRALLYVSVPALVGMGLLVMYVDAGVATGQTAGIENLVWLASAGFVVGITPFVLFITYILRIATIAKRTLAMGPFVLREREAVDH